MRPLRPETESSLRHWTGIWPSTSMQDNSWTSGIPDSFLTRSMRAPKPPNQIQSLSGNSSFSLSFSVRCVFVSFFSPCVLARHFRRIYCKSYCNFRGKTKCNSFLIGFVAFTFSIGKKVKKRAEISPT